MNNEINNKINQLEMDQLHAEMLMPNDRDMSDVEYEAISMLLTIYAEQIDFLKWLLAQIE